MALRNIHHGSQMIATVAEILQRKTSIFFSLVKDKQSKIERGGDFHCPSARMATEASVRFTIRLLNLFMVEV